MNGPLVGQRFSLMKRLTLSLSLMIVMFTIITVLAFVDTDSWQRPFLITILCLVVIVNINSAIFQGGSFGMAGKFPDRYMSGKYYLLHNVLSFYPSESCFRILFQIQTLNQYLEFKFKFQNRDFIQVCVFDDVIQDFYIKFCIKVLLWIWNFQFFSPQIS